MASYLLKIAYFNLPHLHVMSLLGISPNFAEIYGNRNLWVPGLSYATASD